MKKQKIQLIVVLVILVALIGALFGVKQYNKKVEDAENEEDASFEAFSMSEEDIYSFSFTDSDSELLTFDYDGENWSLESDATVSIDNDIISEALSYLTTIQASSIITDGTASDYGLDAPVNVITLKDADGTATTIEIGMTNSITGEYYFTLDEDDENIFVGDGDLLSIENYSLSDFIVSDDTDESSNDATLEDSTDTTDNSDNVTEESTDNNDDTDEEESEVSETEDENN